MSTDKPTMTVALIDQCLNPVGDAELFSDTQWLDALLRFEAGLANAQAAAGLIPASAAAAIAKACASIELDRTDFIERARGTGAFGLGLVDPLRGLLASQEPDALRHLHWGTTTQDAVDTAHALLTKAALDALLDELHRLINALRELAATHADTPMMARSLLQPAQVTSFGFKCAQSAVALQRSVRQLQALAPHALCVQLGGAVGNRAAMGNRAAQVERALAVELGLWSSGQAWHTQRDAWIRLALESAVCAGSVSKLAYDWSLMSQFEVGELAEAPRGRTSSAMPHKRNSVNCMQAIALTQPIPGLASSLLAAMTQAHERAMGEWQAELSTWAPLWRRAHGATGAMRMAAEGLQVDSARMQSHIDALYQVIFSEACSDALAPLVGPEAAQQAIARLAPQALTQRQPLSTLLLHWIETTHGTELARTAAKALATATDPQHAVRASTVCCQELLCTLDAAALSSPTLEPHHA